MYYYILTAHSELLDQFRESDPGCDALDSRNAG